MLYFSIDLILFNHALLPVMIESQTLKYFNDITLAFICSQLEQNIKQLTTNKLNHQPPKNKYELKSSP